MVAYAVHRATAAEIPALRKAPGSLGDSAIAPSLLRHADEQTVVGLAAILRAVARGGLEPGDFAAWAVLAAPRFLGRAMFEAAFPQFLAEGAWGVSPHLVPAHSLHSPSGAFSQALKAHGPNLGVGGTPGGEREAMLAAATLLDSGSVAGIWVVVSGRSGGRDGAVAIETPGDYEALALALVPAKADHGGPRLLVSPDALQLDPKAGSEADRATIAGWLGADPGGSRRVDGGHAAGSTIPAPHFRPAPARAGIARGDRGHS